MDPINPAAHEIVRLRSVNGDIDAQIVELVTRKTEHLKLIDALAAVAEWDDGTAPADPDPAPEETPTPTEEGV